METHNNQEERSVEVEEIAQYVIDNRYPKNEQEKVSDAELYQYVLVSIHHQLQKVREEVAKEICDELIPQPCNCSAIIYKIIQKLRHADPLPTQVTE